MLQDIMKAIQEAVLDQPQINLAAAAAQRKLAERICEDLKGKYYFVKFRDSGPAKTKEHNVE